MARRQRETSVAGPWTREAITSITSVERFLVDVRAHFTSPEDHRLVRSLVCWLAYYRTLQFIRERYGQTNTAYIQAITHYLHTRECGPRATRRAATTAPHAQAEAEALQHKLHDLSASFAIFSRGLLDSMADTFQCYFGLGWPRSDSTHARLTRDFLALCREQGFVLAPTALPTLMRELHAALMASPSSLTPVIDERPEERLAAMSTAINVYSAAMMQFFARNEEHSVLRSTLADHH